MAHAIWKGSISFGLVQIPVGLYSAEESDELHFNLLDKRDMRPIKYDRVNRETGDPVPWDQIVRGYEYDKGQYVIVSDDDFKRANVEATETIDIVDFVDGSEISPLFYEKPYYLAPTAKGMGARAYALLRETMRKTGRVGIAKVVVRTRQHLGVVMVQGDVLVLDTLRWAHELRKADFDVPGEDLSQLGLTDREIQMAERLVEGMITGWQPEKYQDTYRDDLMKLIEERAAAGQIEPVESPLPERPQREGVIDIMTLLKRSLEDAGEKRGKKVAAANETFAEEEPATRTTAKKARPGVKKAATPASTRKRAAGDR